MESSKSENFLRAGEVQLFIRVQLSLVESTDELTTHNYVSIKYYQIRLSIQGCQVGNLKDLDQ